MRSLSVGASCVALAPCGSRTVTKTSVASVGPSFVTLIVSVKPSGTDAGVGEDESETLRSADGGPASTRSGVVAAAFAGVGSAVEAVALAAMV